MLRSVNTIAKIVEMKQNINLQLTTAEYVHVYVPQRPLSKVAYTCSNLITLEMNALLCKCSTPIVLFVLMKVQCMCGI